MFRKASAVAVCLLTLLPLGGGAQIALGDYLGPLPVLQGEAYCWFSPYQLAILAACAMVLSLTAARRWNGSA